jgi:hypothetical protein
MLSTSNHVKASPIVDVNSQHRSVPLAADTKYIKLCGRDFMFTCNIYVFSTFVEDLRSYHTYDTPRHDIYHYEGADVAGFIPSKFLAIERQTAR